MTFYFSLKKNSIYCREPSNKISFPLFFTQLIFQTFTSSQSRFLQTVLKQKNPVLKARPVSICWASAPGIPQAGCRGEAGMLRVRSSSTTPKAKVIILSLWWWLTGCPAGSQRLAADIRQDRKCCELGCRACKENDRFLWVISNGGQF